MPYRRSYRRAPRKRKQNWYNRERTYTYKGAAEAALKGVKYLKGMINSEMNVHDVSFGTALTSTAVITPLAEMAQGDTELLRTGISILSRRLEIRATFSQHTSATISHVRILVVRDKQQVADADPVIGNILKASTVQSQFAHLDKGRFTILKDNVFSLYDVSKTGHTINWSFPMEKHIRYNGAAAGDIQKNGLYLVTLSSEATNGVAVALQTRLFYHDN